MKCSVCKEESAVIDTRIVKGKRYRKRKCACEGAWFTKELRIAGTWPYIDPRIKKPKSKKPKPEPEPQPYTPAVEAWGIKVTKESPEWLKRIALTLG